MIVFQTAKEKRSDIAVVYGYYKGEKTVHIDLRINSEVEKLLFMGFMNEEIGAVTKVPVSLEYQQVFMVCLGEEDAYNETSLLKATRSIQAKLRKEVQIDVASFARAMETNRVVQLLAENIAFYDYQYDEFKSKKNSSDFHVWLITDKDIDAIVDETTILMEALNNTRTLVNKPYNAMSALDLAAYATSLVEKLNCELVDKKILNKEQIEALEMGAFLAVNKGSVCEPRFIHLTYRGGQATQSPIALIGKGVMFDTGGYSIKTSMNTMKCDMAGAATVLGVFEALVRNKVAINVDCIIAATDNRINGEAYLPDDVVTAMNKKTIEIVSTDAEGRLTLADAITYAQKEGAKEVIDFATLTGAVVVALGDYITGLFGNDEEGIQSILQVSKSAYEGLWHMPITERIREQVRGSKVADITNSTGRSAGASGAAAFLEEFVEEGTKWMHLDIAGTAYLTTPAYQEFYGATGAMVKTTYQYLKRKRL